MQEGLRSTPYNYIQNKFETIKNTKYILLGNAANLFLDEFVNERTEIPVVYSDTMRKVFKGAPFEFSTCDDINTKDQEVTFFQDTQTQFHNIKNTVNNIFPNLSIDKEKGILEPGFICEQLGLQGRLDYLQIDQFQRSNFVIELKSGKAPFPENDPSLINLNHLSQAFMYQIVIQKVLGIGFLRYKRIYSIQSIATKISICGLSDLIWWL